MYIVSLFSLSCIQKNACNRLLEMNEKAIWKLFQSHFCIELSLHIMELNPTRTCYFTEKIWFQWLGEEADFIWSTLAVLPSQRTLTMSHLASLHWEMSSWLSLMAKDMFLIGNKNILLHWKPSNCRYMYVMSTYKHG